MIAVAVGVTSPLCLNAQPASHSGAVFLMTNAADRNEVLAYDRAADGSLTFGERYDTGGRGSGGVTDPLGSQGSITLSQDHSLLFVANAGSGSVSVFAVHGSHLWLQQKLPSGGTTPVSIARQGNLLYILNQGAAGNVVGFFQDHDGRFKPIENSTRYLSANDVNSSSISLTPNGQFLLVAERGSGKLDVFPVLADGTLGAAVVTPSPGPGLFDATIAPNGIAIANETGPAGGSNASAVTSYSIQPNGTLTPISQSVPTFGNANCWSAITPNGKWIYVDNSASNTISGFSIGTTGQLTPIGDTVLATLPQGSRNIDLAISAEGKYLYTLDTDNGTIGIFAIQHDGTLSYVTETGDLPKSAGFNGIAAL
jgi:6-phosphogluconolactonase (cycloisomerase 2 family)